MILHPRCVGGHSTPHIQLEGSVMSDVLDIPFRNEPPAGGLFARIRRRYELY
jgi:hypothetical protein